MKDALVLMLRVKTLDKYSPKRKLRMVSHVTTSQQKLSYSQRSIIEKREWSSRCHFEGKKRRGEERRGGSFMNQRLWIRSTPGFTYLWMHYILPALALYTIHVLRHSLSNESYLPIPQWPSG
jgi:hypothetical protein